MRSVISKSFTGFDGWVSPAGSHLCGACRWSYTDPGLRRVPHLITREPAGIREQTLAQVQELLGRGAVGGAIALVVPLRPGRKHILPDASWGRVNIDNAQLSWTVQDAGRLQAMVELRAMGFGTRMLCSPTPAYPVLRSLPAESWARVLQLWDQVEPWRTSDNPWLDLAVRITTPQISKAEIRSAEITQESR